MVRDFLGVVRRPTAIYFRNQMALRRAVTDFSFIIRNQRAPIDECGIALSGSTCRPLPTMNLKVGGTQDDED